MRRRKMGRAGLAVLGATLLAGCGGGSGKLERGNYRAMKTALLIPLGTLIVAVRGRIATVQDRLTLFNAEAEKVLPLIDKDVSENGNRLHSVITNVREAAKRGDLKELEKQRLELMKIS